MDARVVERLVDLGYLRQPSPLTRDQYHGAILRALQSLAAHEQLTVDQVYANPGLAAAFERKQMHGAE